MTSLTPICSGVDEEDREDGEHGVCEVPDVLTWVEMPARLKLTVGALAAGTLGWMCTWLRRLMGP